MIRYALVCEAGHEFESWFASANSFDAQARRGLVSCAHCGSSRVAKAIMAPSIARRDRDRTPAPDAPPPADAGAPAATQAPGPVTLLDERQRALREMVRALRAEIDSKTENLGRAFPEEARRIHEGEAPRRSIRGEATPEEARALIEDGVEILPLPMLPDERN